MGRKRHTQAVFERPMKESRLIEYRDVQDHSNLICG